MDDRAINLRKQEISRKHDEWLKHACDCAEACLAACEMVDSPEQKVRALTSEVRLASGFGAPGDNFDLKLSQHEYDLWLVQLWGRRCSYYISNLATGLRAALALQKNDSRLDELLLRFEQLEASLSERFKRRWESGFTPEQSLRSRGDISNFHVTYLDPVLFSALYLLHRNQSDNHILDQKTDRVIWRIIMKEVAKCTAGGTGISQLVKDDSTVWWGFTELVKRAQAHFSLGRNKACGWNEVVRVCRNLIRNNDGHLRFPHNDETLYEATPEVYGQTRTRILVAMNCIELAKILPPVYLRRICWELAQFANGQFTNVFNDSARIKGHLGLLGLGLQLTARTLACLEASSRKLQDTLDSETNAADRLAESPAPADPDRLIFCYRPDKTPPNEPDSNARANKHKYHIFVDGHEVWIRPPRSKAARLEPFHPQQQKLLSLLLRYRGQEMDVRGFSQQLGYAPETFLKDSEIAGDLAVRLTRFRKKMKRLFPVDVFHLPNKIHGHGYCCTGSFRSCLIIPQKLDREYRVKTIEAI